jgi:GNAT superfamily N-acetyltransferase
MDTQLAELNPLHIEEAALNAWPALQTYLFDGWLARFANGYTKRANSITPLYPALMDLAEKIDWGEKLYRKQNLPPVFRLPSFVEPGEIDGRLAQRGYKKIDTTSVQVLDLSLCFAQSSPRAFILPGRSGLESWLGAFHRMSGANPARDDAETHQQMLNNIIGQKCFMTLLVENEVVACGMAVASHDSVGIFDVIVAPEHRRQGYGLELMESLLDWAVNQHAHYAYLQVVAVNQPAINLYTKLKFAELYQYWYRVLPK